MELEPNKPTSLEDCPIGLFMYKDTLVLKTEYGNNDGWLDCYIVDSGEKFWAGCNTPEEMRNLRVYPITVK
ncbi:MAG: hypothetical protein WC055_12025 [Melioribacteraceae bacterium]